MRVRSIAIACMLLLGAAAAHAQDGRLDRVQNLIATGRLTEARNTLAQWERDNGDPDSSASSDDRARALYLEGVLSTDAKIAEDAFIRVVLSYPSAPVAPQALLRLGQSFFTAGDNTRAIDYLERLRSDYPHAPERQTGMLWLARAQLAQGNAVIACGTARDALFGTSDANVRTLIELERDRACAQSGGVAAGDRDAAAPASIPAPPRTASPAPIREMPAAAPTRDAAPATTQPAAASTATPVPAPGRAPALPDLGIAVDENVREAQRIESRTVERDTMRTSSRPAESARPMPRDTVRFDISRDARAAASSSPEARHPVSADPAPAPSAPALTGEFAVQTAAFSERRPAETIAAELRAKGFDARIVQVPGSPFFRVRHGVFNTSREAANAALYIRDAGFATLVVNDVRLERKP